MDTTIIHPVMVHFPVALLSAGFAVDIAGIYTRKELCFSKAGFILLFLGFLGAVAAFLTGFFLTSELEGEAGIAKERHELFAIFTIIAVSVSLAFRLFVQIRKNEEKNMQYAVLGLVMVTAVLVLITGYLGGDLVWSYLIGL